MWIVRLWKNLTFIQSTISRAIRLTAAAIIQFVALREREGPCAVWAERVSKSGTAPRGARRLPLLGL
jgi:hypothetical protein